MAVEWTVVGTLGLVVGIIFAALATLIFRNSPARLQPRTLALFLLLEAASVGCGAGLMYLTDDRAATFAWQAVADVVFFLQIPVHVLFLSTIRTPLTRPLATLGARLAMLLFVPLSLVLYFLEQERFLSAVVPGEFSPWDVHKGVWSVRTTFVSAMISFYALAAAIDAWRRSPRGSAQRSRNRAFAVAFGIRDVGLGVPFFLAGAGLTEGHEAFFWTYIVLPLVVGLAFVFALSYAILKSHLFDIDLRLKFTLRRGTLAGIFIAVFFVASEVAQQVFQASVGPYVGILAAGILVFAFSPLQSIAERLSDAAFPKVTGKGNYMQFRKMEVYKAAAEEFLADGHISGKERRALDAVRARLGIAAGDAGAVERDVQALYAPA